MPVKKEKVIPKWVQENFDLLNKLKEDGVEVFSYSRLKAFKQCKGAYRDSYIEKKKKANNVYAIIGSHIHDALEDIYDNDWSDEENRELLLAGLNNALSEIGTHNAEANKKRDFYGNLPDGEYELKFMSENVEANYMKSMMNYVNMFKKEDVKRLNEALIVVELNGKYMQGYIDVIQEDKDGEGGTLKIIDYKTSSLWASKEKTDEHAQQLLFYAWAIMKKYPKLKVTSVSWNMLKYINIRYLGKTRKKNTLFRRDKIFDKKYGVLTEMYDAFKIKGYNDMETAMILADAMVDNIMPKEIEDMFEIWEGYYDYPVNEDTLKMATDALSEIMDNIDSEKDFEYIEIDPKDDFNCIHLCSHRYSCEVRKKYLRGKIQQKEAATGMKFDDVF